MDTMIEIGKIILMVAGVGGILAALAFFAALRNEELEKEEARREYREKEETRSRRIEIAEVAKKAMIPDINGISHCFIKVGDILRGHADNMGFLERRVNALSRRVEELEMARAVESPEKHENHDTDMGQMESLGKSRRKHGTRA